MVKRAIMYLFAAGPVLLLGLIAINSRFNQGQWEFVEYSVDAENRLMAYVATVKEARAHFKSPEHKACKEHCPAVDTWLAAYRTGDLRDVYPPSAAFETAIPVYGNVMADRNEVLTQALRMAKHLKEEGRHEEATKAFMDVAELAETAKYSEFGSYVESTIYQVDALGQIVELSPSLAVDTREALFARLVRLETPQRNLANTVDRLADAYRRDQARRGELTVSIVAASDGYKLASAVDPTQEKIEGWQDMIQYDPNATTLYAQSQLALVQSNRLVEQVARAMVALSDPS